MLARCERNFLAAETWRSSHQARWERYYKLSQSYTERAAGEWGSKVFVPEVFKTIETIKPRLVAQIPEPIVYPVGPEDEAGAPAMEEMLKWCADQSGLYLELVQGFDSALRYGTGIFKVTPGKRVVRRRKRQPVMVPVMAPSQPVLDPDTGRPMNDLEGNPLVSEVETGEMEPDPSGATETVDEEIVTYVGPYAECLDIFSVYPDPLATSFEDAEFVIQRSFKSRSWCDERFRSGYFRRGDRIGEADYAASLDDPAQQRLASVGLGGSGGLDKDNDRIEVWECWYRDGTVVTTLARKAIVRVVANPFDHGGFPYVRILDYMNAHEFWGQGEVQHLEGIQDLINAMTNQRVNEVRLVMNPPWLFDSSVITDAGDLSLAPGKAIGVNAGQQGLPNVVQRIEMGDITGSAYSEVQFWQDVAEQTSGVSAYQTGTDSESLNDTATGVALISEQGNSRFALKLRIAELTGLRELYRQFGALIQQFTPPDFIMRIQGPDGSMTFAQVEPAALYGAFDYDIESESSTQTETVRKQQAMDGLQVSTTIIDPATGQPVFNVRAMGEDWLRVNGKKDMERYMAPIPEAVPTDPMTGEPMALPPGMAPMNGQVPAEAMA